MANHIETLARNDGKMRSMDTGRFMLWLFIVSSVMFFAGLTSAYLVKRAAGNWLSFPLPVIFSYTAILSFLSSFSAHLSYLSAKKNNTWALQAFSLITILLGVFFLMGQYMGWQSLVSEHVYFVGNAAGSFVYVVSGTHALHALVGTMLFLVMVVRIFFSRWRGGNLKFVQLSAIYWHFVGFLWIYLYGFLSFTR